MIGGEFIKAYVIRKAQESTTWAGIVTFIAGSLGANVSPELRDQIVAVALPIVSLCLVLANERKGPNPQNAPLDPACPPVSADIVQLPRNASTASGGAMPSRDNAAIRPAVLDDGSPAHPPIRPGFGPRT